LISRPYDFFFLLCKFGLDFSFDGLGSLSISFVICDFDPFLIEFDRSYIVLNGATVLLFLESKDILYIEETLAL
jgi:hypothetical protein